MDELAWPAGLSLVGAIALGLPLRLLGWRATWAAVVAGWRFLRSHRWKILLVFLVGAALGLWSLGLVQEIAFGLWR